jgi:phospholipase C
MKLAVRSLILLAVLGSVLAHAQIPAIQHIIVVVQENRTPDNLFQDQNLRNAGRTSSKKAKAGCAAACQCRSNPDHWAQTASIQITTTTAAGYARTIPAIWMGLAS